VEIEIRPVSGYDDLERWVAARNEAVPDDPQNTVMMALVRASELSRLDLVAVEGDEVVGTGFLGGDPKSVESSHPWVEVTVPPRHRRRGVGSALLAAFSEHLRGLGKEGMETEARAHDEESVAFLRRRGFAEVRRIPQFELDLDAPLPETKPIPGVRMEWFSDRPELLEGMYRVATAAYPGFGPFLAEQTRTQHEWQLYALGDPSLVLELVPVALAGDEVIGFSTMLRLAEPGVAVHYITAVMPEWQPAGIGKALLREIIAGAPAAGFRHLCAWPRGDEAARSHEALGYRRGTETIIFRGPLQD
jgi:GNAT superfamily N-acetyltransferase